MKRKIKITILIIIVILLIPVRKIYKDGETITYTSLTYKIIKWNKIDGKKETSFYIFPFNFKNIDDYKEKLSNEELSDIFLISDKDIYNLEDEKIEFAIINNTKKTLYTHASPTLEIKTNNGWEILDKNDTGVFCGNKDNINQSINVSLLLSWYDNLKIGNYRISFNIYNGYDSEKKIHTVSKEFYIQSKQTENSVNCNKGDFEMNLFSDKHIYESTDRIKIWGTLKYIGKDSQITIWHASSYMIFSISDGKDFNVDGIVNDILKSTVLDKNKLYTFDYQKSGGFDTNDPKADFWKQFYKEKDLMLPEGQYTITLVGDFWFSSNMQNQDSLICKLEIKVI